MLRRGLALCLSLGMFSTTFGGARIDLVPNPAGTYTPGQAVVVDVMLAQDPAEAGDRLLRLFQGDFTATTPALRSGITLPAMVSGINGFDFSGVAAAGAGQFVDDDLNDAAPLGPNLISTTYFFQNQANLGPNSNAQINIPMTGAAVRIARLNVTVPNAGGDYVLDVVNALEPDQNKGGVVIWGFGIDGDLQGPVQIYRPGAGLLGGTLTMTVVPVDNPPLTASNPACGQSWWRTQNNVAVLTFGGVLAAVPTAGQVQINELLAGGTFGPDLSASFTFAIDNGNQLRVRETGDSALDHRKWYCIRNVSWPNAMPFKVDIVMMIGDTNGDNRVTALDTGFINPAVPCVSNCDPRKDTNGDNRITALDVGVVNPRVPSLTPTKPTGQSCLP